MYTAEFKLAAVSRVKDGQGVAVARELGISEQTLRNWVKAEASGKLNGAGAKPVTPEQMELSRLRAQNKCLQMELELAKMYGPPRLCKWAFSDETVCVNVSGLSRVSRFGRHGHDGICALGSQ
ncbi:Mobile element protein [Burkholderia singularis]|uniref:Mobile element protein n=1 Tax=Burkholderia singularis TaxID=1503053 RepID=A0A238GY97_9BURK|nr:Mobile element protein [Burkholderia singularis]